MRALREVFFAAFVLAAFCWIAAAAPVESDQAAAERVLGPQWRQLSRRAGMVFAGTVLSGRMQSSTTDRAVPSVALQFRVDRAIAGVEPGTTLTIHEWTGATSLHPPMRAGERFLLFLYPPSRLSLTSPVGGAQGLIRLDTTGRAVADPRLPTAIGLRNAIAVPSNAPVAGKAAGSAEQTRSPVTIDQLERAIRSARER